MEKQISLLEEAQRVGAEVLAFTNLTSHPDDWYLSKVLAKRNGEYVTWIFNWSVGCLNSGHYYSTWDSAEADYKARK